MSRKDSAKDSRSIQFRDAAELEAWLIGEIARRLRLSPEQVDPEAALSNLGVDSRTAVALSGDLEKILKRELPPTLLWDYPTIQILARELMADSVAAQ